MKTGATATLSGLSSARPDNAPDCDCTPERWQAGWFRRPARMFLVRPPELANRPLLFPFDNHRRDVRFDVSARPSQPPGWPDPTVHGAPDRPSHVSYRQDEFVLAATAAVLGQAFGSGDFSYVGVGNLLLGPCMTAQLEAAGFFRRRRSVTLWTPLSGPDAMYLVRGRLLQTMQDQEAVDGLVNVVRNDVVADEESCFRYPTACELSWYWSITPYDLVDPALVVSTIDHEYFIHRVRGSTWYVDDYQGLRWQ